MTPQIQCCDIKFAVEVHLPLILRISAKNPHHDAINPQKKFATGTAKISRSESMYVDAFALLRYIFSGR